MENAFCVLGPIGLDALTTERLSYDLIHFVRYLRLVKTAEKLGSFHIKLRQKKTFSIK